jgi:hypothetical protein
VVHFLFSGGPNRSIHYLPLAWLLASCRACRVVVDEEISVLIATLVASENSAERAKGLRLAVSLQYAFWSIQGGRGPGLSYGGHMDLFWAERSAQNVTAYADAIIVAAADSPYMRHTALRHSLITVDQALKMHGGLLPLLQVQPTGLFGVSMASYLVHRLYNLANGRFTADDPGQLAKARSDLAATGRYLSNNPQPSWINGSTERWSTFTWSELIDKSAEPSDLGSLAYLGGAAVLLMSAESDKSRPAQVLNGDPSRLGPFIDLYAYLEHRHGDLSRALPELPVPDEFKQVFRDWAEGRVNFTEQE